VLCHASIITGSPPSPSPSLLPVHMQGLLHRVDSGGQGGWLQRMQEAAAAGRVHVHKLPLLVNGTRYTACAGTLVLKHSVQPVMSSCAMCL
jgi:hypothetical protein